MIGVVIAPVLHLLDIQAAKQHKNARHAAVRVVLAVAGPVDAALPLASTLAPRSRVT